MRTRWPQSMVTASAGDAALVASMAAILLPSTSTCLPDWTEAALPSNRRRLRNNTFVVGPAGWALADPTWLPTATAAPSPARKSRREKSLRRREIPCSCGVQQKQLVPVGIIAVLSSLRSTSQACSGL